ncbi:ead/Ea22-like family protein [Pseudomonas aeruginosa]|uniref:ead/Ea22-like family protein n=1 Tax=Pseudomonas aeruginosa TaxID=287 RepID=UPI000F4565A5|nr:ead/Ea22-like family protein [Pseudomonas aeruginosa]EKL0657265.1 ead/Ea22-like family protein [Pseudomonas aeruginosa]EKU4547757.1 ead/Ea22-like family protein [Pseudomonas aeruginosa]EKV6736699.1 ead/Ea22-like family protein [Pseudomonas aeruginosa]EKV6880032.1 ead/Ea22-like family protein [Pseudomonas aeruginosa]EKX0392481.1 ead/Ea22-like family protein [Pseudomonas aeruginosa]
MDEPLFNELLESVKQADQIMTDHAELRRVAGLASGGNWYGEDSQVLVGKHAIAYCNHKVDAQFIGEANPKTILALLDEIDGLKAENEALLLGMRAILNAYDYADQYNKEGVAVEVMEDLRTLFKGATQ